VRRDNAFERRFERKMGGSCSVESPQDCSCNRVNVPGYPYEPLLDSFQDMMSWCWYGGIGEQNECCYQIGDSYASLGVTYEEYTCKLPNMEKVKQSPVDCKIPCSNSFPENCPQCSSAFNMTILDTHSWCTENSECCGSQIIDGTPNMKRFDEISRTCQVLNQTMVNLYPKKCTMPTLPVSHWRSPITSGAKCFTSHFVKNEKENHGLSYVKQNESLGNDFFCMNYFSWYEPLARYVAVATTGDEKLYSSMALYPNNYMMLQKCSGDYCNDVDIFQQTHNKSFTPDISGQSGAGLSCFKGTYPDVNSAFIYNADVCVRYSFKPNFNSSIVTVYDGLPFSFLPLLKGSLFAQNVTDCSTANCNSIITPASTNTASVLSPGGNMTCFGSIDSAGVVVPHPLPIPDPETKYCVTVTSVIDGIKMFFSAKSFELFSDYSNKASLDVCNTSLCNAQESPTRNLSCYLTDPKNVTNHIQSNLVLPVDYCVKYRTSSGEEIYSGVTFNQLNFMNGTSKFTELEACETNFCLVP
jgi:hypothetical protein